MKKEYAKPLLVKRGKMSAVTAAAPILSRRRLTSEGIEMKKEYAKPLLIKRGVLSAVTAVPDDSLIIKVP